MTATKPDQNPRPDQVAMLCHGDEVYGIGTIQKLYALNAPGMHFVCYGKGALLDWLGERDCRVHLVEGLNSFSAGGSASTLLRLPGVMARARRSAERTHRLLKSLDVKLIHTHWLPQQLTAGFMRRFGYRAVWQINNNMNRGRLFGLGVRLNHRLARWGADMLLPASEFIAGNWRASGVPTRVVHNAADALYDCANGLAAAPIRCLIAGRLTESKGHHLALRAVLSARDKGHPIELDIFGGPIEGNEYAASLKQQVEAAGHGDAVRLMGFRTDLRQLHQDYHLGLQCRIDPEPCSMWVCETLVDGLPLIAAANGGTPELVRDGVTGLLFKSGDGQDLAGKLIQLAGNPARLSEMRQAAFTRGQEHLLTGRFIRETFEAYASIG